MPTTPRCTAVSLLVCSAVLSAACSATDGLMDSVALSPPGSAAVAPDAAQPAAVAVSDHQRSYLDALRAHGVTPSSELMALRIGSSVCQSRAAGQSDRAVWDLVAPLVRADREQLGHVVVAGDPGAPSSPVPDAAGLNGVTADYIRIASDRLC